MDDGAKSKNASEQKVPIGTQAGGNPLPGWAERLLISALITLVEQLATKLRTRRGTRKPKREKTPE